MLFSFRLAIFLGAGLLFLVQPMFAKMALPLLGGSPAVWNTCMLFFQAVLLAGYVYAHMSHRWLARKSRVLVHLGMLVTVLLLPTIAISSDWSPPDDDSPIFWLLGLLLVVVGGPFFAVSATGPLLQQWFASSGHTRSANPYFLYSASNTGSMVALLAYPFLFERIFSLDQQGQLWKAGYLVFVLATSVCGFFVWQGRNDGDTAPPADDLPPVERISWKRRLTWVGLAFVPSSWMLGVTSFLTTDVSPMPILWILPLSIYLVTFIVAFSDRPILSRVWLNRLFPVSMLIVCSTSIFRGGFLVMGLHLLIFFVGGMVSHFELARRKPAAADLTGFYLWVSVGGLLGGVFNGLLAPLLFPWILEYPLTLMLACILCPAFDPNPPAQESAAELSLDRKQKTKRKKTGRDQPPEDSGGGVEKQIKLGMFLLFAAVLGLLVNLSGFQGTATLILVTMAGLALLCVCYFLDRPAWFAVPLGVVLVMARLEPPQPGETVIHTARGFFGVNRVVDGPRGYQKRLYHGTTVHGIQSTHPDRAVWNLAPMSYYHRTGPLGMVFDNAQKNAPFRRVGVIGLGAGTAATYCQPGQSFTFFEIDPIVQRIAEDPTYFTFLENCGKQNYEIILGDGRLKLSKQANGQFDFLVFDAFSSDAIPMHLLTREAVGMYADKLGKDGLMAFHISNLHFDLEPILGDIAAALELESLTCHDRELSEEEMIEGKAASSYVVIAKDLQRTGLAGHRLWKTTRRSSRKHPWTDDFSNLFDALKKGE